MNRADMSTFLDNWHSEIKTALVLASWSPVIDRALSAFGVASADLADYETEDESDNELIGALLSWWALERALNAYSIQVSFSIANPSVSVSLSDAYERLKKQQDSVNARLQSFGYAQSGITSGNILVNWMTVEPVI